MAATGRLKKWAHDPARTDHESPQQSRGGLVPFLSNACYGCWCYACGGRTDQPRKVGNDTRTGLADPTSHRWCFE